jgi:hypothetical protein
LTAIISDNSGGARRVISLFEGPDRIVRPIITFVIFASGLKYIGVSTTTLGWILCVTALLVAAVWTARTRPWRNRVRASTVGMAAGGAPPIDSAVAPVDERRRT